jgi:hypothetical protein
MDKHDETIANCDLLCQCEVAFFLSQPTNRQTPIQVRVLFINGYPRI